MQTSVFVVKPEYCASNVSEKQEVLFRFFNYKQRIRIR